MKPAVKIFNNVLAVEFYKTNAAFFLVVLGLAGGFMRSADHIALAESFLGSPALLSIPIAVWTIFLFQIIQFNLAAMRRKENEFIFLGGLLTKRALVSVLFVVAATQLIPVYLYGFFLIAVAIKHHLIISGTVVMVAMITLQLTLVGVIHRTLTHPNLDRPVGLLNSIFDRIVRRYPLMVIEWVMRRKPIALVGFKIFSCLLLYGVWTLYEPSFDARFLGMTMTIVIGFQMTLVYEVHRFDNVHFSLLRQLPITAFQKIQYTTSVLVILMLPETGMILTLFPSHLSTIDCIATLAYGWSGIALLYAFLYVKDRSEEQLTVFAFAGVMLFFVLILSHTPLSALAILNIAVTYTIIRKYYYKFELISR